MDLRSPLTFRRRLRDRSLVIGPWCVIPSPAAAVATAGAGVDFGIIDLEHGAFDHETMVACIHALRGQGAAALVRPPALTADGVQKALDGGADGVVIAGVSSVEQAETLRELARYAPEGSRGFSPFTPAGSVAGQDGPRHRRESNERIATVGIIESAEALDRVEAIAATGAFDALYVGAYDLSSSLGYDGNVEDPAFREEFRVAVQRVIATGTPAGGYVARSPEHVRWLAGIGVTFITCEVDLGALFKTYKGLVAAVPERSGE